MEYQVFPITAQDADDIATWKYPSPYDMYSLSVEFIPTFLNPMNRYFIVRAREDNLVGFCCFGSEARVMGGDYMVDDSILDVGVGMRPDRVGKGEGRDFVEAVLSYATKRFKPVRFRVTIAEFNQRSLKTFRSLGFNQTHRFTRLDDNLEFIQLERDAFNDSHPGAT
jgi:ribosomal-protein-alanine N-acetyltransferase